MAEVKRIFQSINMVKECVDRHVAALVGRFPVWYLKDKKGTRVEASEAEVLLQRWLAAVQQRAASGATEQGDPFFEAVTALAINGEGALRLWQPARFENAPDPIDRIHLHAVKPGSLEVERGDDGFIDELRYRYGNGKTEVERLEINGDLTIESSELEEPLTLATGGRWTISQMRSPSLLTPQIKQNQDAINHSLTMMLRNQEQAGFLDRIFLNAQPPGEWVDDATVPGGQRFVPNGKGLEKGAGIDNFLFGVPTGDPANPTYTTPSVVTNQPIAPDGFLKSIAAYREFIYHSFGQGHLLASADGNINGVSRIQLRQDFEMKLTRQKTTIEAAIANILNVVLRILGYEELEAVVQLRITTGKLSPEERQMIITEFDKGLLSKATAIALLGSVEDVDSELALIREEATEEMRSRSSDDDDDPPVPNNEPTPPNNEPTDEEPDEA
jgi:hypothetical protein